MKVDQLMITVGEAKECCGTPLFDALAFATTKVLPLYLTAARITPIGLVAALAADFTIKVIEKAAKHYLVDRCLIMAASSHLHVDKRLTIASATQSPTGKRVRKRVGEDILFLPGGGEFGGAGAGSSWSEIDPITGIGLSDRSTEERGIATPVENPPGQFHQNRIQVDGQISRPLVGFEQRFTDPKLDAERRVFIEPDALLVSHYVQDGPFYWITGVNLNLQGFHALASTAIV